MSGNTFGELLNGHPYEAVTGSHSNFENAIDGHPGDILSSQGDKTNGAPAAGPTAPVDLSAPVPSANGFAPPTVNNNNIIPLSTPPSANGSVPPANPLASTGAPPANPLASASATPVAPTPVPPQQSTMASPVMAHIQSPGFGNFMQTLSHSLNQNNQIAGS